MDKIYEIFLELKNIDFLSWRFYFLLLLVILLYWILPAVCRKGILFLASILFYFSNGIPSLLLLCYLISVSWITGKVLYRVRTKAVLWGGIVPVLLPILYVRIADKMLRGGVFLYIGLSYTTMMALGYLIDVYHNICQLYSLSDYAVFLAFFPYSLSGPIERADRICPQIEELRKKKFSWQEVQSGIVLIIYGLFTKLVVADRIGILVNFVLDDFRYYIGLELLVALVLYGIEIYCDFSACSDIARGLAKCFGIHIINNFQQPYFSENISMFWQRWHVSFSSWLRDYIYIPLGGNRKGKARQCINICITFLVSGLWHGLRWPFVLWGLLHGVYQIIGKMTVGVRKRINYILKTDVRTMGHKIYQMLLTFILVDFAWLFFRVERVSDGIDIIKRIIFGIDWSFMNSGWLNLGLDQRDWNVLWIGLLIILTVDIMHYIYKQEFIHIFLNENIMVKYISVVVIFILLVIYGIYGAGYDAAAFIYRGF